MVEPPRLEGTELDTRLQALHHPLAVHPTSHCVNATL